MVELLLVQILKPCVRMFLLNVMAVIFLVRKNCSKNKKKAKNVCVQLVVLMFHKKHLCHYFQLMTMTRTKNLLIIYFIFTKKLFYNFKNEFILYRINAKE